MKAGTEEGGAGAAAASGPLDKVQAIMRGRKASADQITVQGVEDKHMVQAAQAMEGFSGGGHACAVSTLCAQH